MSNWAVGLVGSPARVFVQATDPAHLISQMLPGETLAPVTEAHRNHPWGVRLLGDLKVEMIEPDEAG